VEEEESKDHIMRPGIKSPGKKKETLAKEDKQSDQ
jgi:hypothetical protein